MRLLPHRGLHAQRLRASVLAVGSLVAAFLLPSAAAAVPSAPQDPPPDTAFHHDTHAELQCLDCHAMQDKHGAFLIVEVADCQDCHHTGEVVGQGCRTCHLKDEMQAEVHVLSRGFRLSVVEDASRRSVRFVHADHAERECAECHAEGPALSVPDLDCQTCHEEHHKETLDGCVGCHRPAPEGAHTPEVHLTCSGSGCHVGGPFPTVPPTRVGCLWCHEEQEDHEPDGECVDCHLVSGPALSVPSVPLNRGG